MPKEFGYIRIVEKKAVGLGRGDENSLSAVLPPTEEEYVLNTLGGSGWTLAPGTLQAAYGENHELQIEREVSDEPFVAEGGVATATYEYYHVPLIDVARRDEIQHEYERNGWDLVAVMGKADGSAPYLQFRRPHR
jgi:hypothetical protein